MDTKIESLVKVFKALGEPNRLQIVLSIGKNSLSVTEVINATGLSQTLVSFHLRALRNAKIVKTKRNGPFIYYSLSEPTVIDVLNELCRTINSKGLISKEILDSVPNRLLKKRWKEWVYG